PEASGRLLCGVRRRGRPCRYDRRPRYRRVASMSRLSLALVAGATAAWVTTAEGHFQLLYTPDAALNEARAVPLALVFSHPFDNGYTKDMGTPEAFYVVSQRGPDAAKVTTDLMERLEPVTWSAVDTTAAAFVAHPSRRTIRSLGDYTFVLKPAP